MNSRFFKRCHVYSNWLKMAHVGEFPWSRFLEDHTQQKEIRRRLFTSPVKLAVSTFSAVYQCFQCESV